MDCAAKACFTLSGTNRLGAFHLKEVKLDRCLSSKERNEHFQLGSVSMHLIYDAHEVHERAIGDTNRLPFGESDTHAGLVGVLEAEYGLLFALIEGNGARPRASLSSSAETKPVTPGVLRTICQLSSSIRMCTKDVSREKLAGKPSCAALPESRFRPLAGRTPQESYGPGPCWTRAAQDSA